MKFRRGRRAAPAGVELTPLIDVVLLLLIFFMVSTTFVKDAALALRLPQAAGAAAVEAAADDEFEVRVSADGDYAVNGAALAGRDLEALTRAMRAQVEGGSERLHVAADARAEHQAVVRVLDAARQLGLTRVRIGAQQPVD